MSDFIEYVQDLLAGLGPVSARRMFGGYGLYHDEVMIGLVMDDGLYLKADDASKAQFEAAGSAPFVYEGGGKRVTMSYWSVPEAALDSPQAMLPWARLALQAALRKSAAPASAARHPGQAAAAKKEPPPGS